MSKEADSVVRMGHGVCMAGYDYVLDVSVGWSDSGGRGIE